MSETRLNSAQDSSLDIQTLKGFGEKPPRGRERARILQYCRLVGPNSAQHYSLLSSFLFLSGFKNP
jgi:hypothetical protein